MIHEKKLLWPGREDVSLTTYVLDDSQEMLAGKARPAVIVCPGGAYLSCSDREGEPVALRFNAMGYHAFVLRYSVYSENKGGMLFGGDKDAQAKPWLTHPAPMRDIARAMLEIRAHAAEWKVDMEKIALCGFSAGAHNCAMYSVYWDKPVMREPFDVEAEALRPAATILGYTLSDYCFMEQAAGGSEDPMARGLFEMSNLAFTGQRRPGPELLEAISPARLVTKATPPMFLWATAGDRLVPVQHSTLMATALANAGVPFEMHIFEQGDHGLAMADQSTAHDVGQLNPDAARWAGLCQAWLEKRFALNLPQEAGW